MTASLLFRFFFFISILFVSILGFNKDIPIVFISSFTVFFGVYFCFLLLRDHKFATGMLSAFLLYSLIPLWAMQVLANFPLSNWRGQIFSHQDIFGAISFYCSSYLLYAFFIVLVSIIFPIPKNRGQNSYSVLYVYKFPNLRFLRIATFVFGSLTLLAMMGQTRDAWIADADIGDRFVMQVTTIGSIAAYAANLEARRYSGLKIYLIDHFVLIVSLVIAIQGFRFMLVGAALSLLYSYRRILKLEIATIFWLIISILILFSMLVLGMGIRALAGSDGIGVFDAISIIEVEYLLFFLGAGEQTVMLALKYFLENPVELLYGQTYVDSIIRVAPNIVHSSLNTLRPQDYIIQEFSWVSDWFASSGLNIGSHLLIEGLINFGVVGSVVTFIVFGIIVSFLDYIIIMKNKYVSLGYAVCTFSYTAAWYGSTVFFKYTIFFLTTFSMLHWIARSKIVHNR